MYSVPARAETCGATETILGNWWAGKRRACARPGGAGHQSGRARRAACPGSGASSPGLSRAEIINACEASLRRLQTEVIDLYQIHWPARNTPAFGALYFDPSKDKRVCLHP
jgi:aryl-alcohol dehydrogenase-like predicted oxidoreductase